MDRKSRREGEEWELDDGIWKYVFGFTEMAVVRCGIELGIADYLERQKEGATLEQLSCALGCSPSNLYRIMRFLINRGIFKEVGMEESGGVVYGQTPLSAVLMRRESEKSMAALVRLESSAVMLAPWLKLSGRVRQEEEASDAFCAANGGKDVWEYSESDPEHSKLIQDAMACHARVAVPSILKVCPDLLNGVECVVDVGGGDGTAVEMLVNAFPGVVKKGINFDLPHVVSVAPNRSGVDHVGGNMFQRVPKADAVFLMWVLHDWGEEECIQILSKCREAIPEESGKVIIAEAVLKEETNSGGGGHCSYQFQVGLFLDMVMMAHTGNGFERTENQWSHLLTAAGFKSYTLTHTSDVVSIIQACP